MKLGYQVLPEFVVVQHERDIQILEAMKTYFKCGYIKVNHGDRLCYVVRDVTHLLTIILPFFEKHQLVSKKRVDFEKFRRIVRMMGDKEHLNEQGLEKIKDIITDMRKYYIVDHKKVTRNEMKDKVQPLDVSDIRAIIDHPSKDKG